MNDWALVHIEQVGGLVRERNSLCRVLAEIVRMADANADCTTDLVVIRSSVIAEARELLQSINYIYKPE